ncbi:CPBP family intramembrane metalloprotease [Schaalia sp. 19OD2882]|uniref:type II CAAX endopeptidase family protein n=1 Tax=Schaalia sp. 19OD2882 TaxID=2794089 RepID=UPI001C1EE41A|nr:type II CAAX endopeptidase family protein [Schaalia sp. 19OD2882]QWW19113.1 CPBP family intramembrane metalloprotease [Schaalia sp. 19OD2882]
MTGFLRSRPVLGFILLAYTGAWIVWSPMVLGSSGLRVLPLEISDTAVKVINVLGLFAGPFIASLVMTKVVHGSFKPWLAGWMRVRPWWVWPVALVLFPAVMAGLMMLLAGPATGQPALSGPAAVIAPVLMFLGFLIGGPVQEEPGWRGFALPQLQQRFHPLAAATVLGFVWALWHLPLFAVAAWDTPKDSILDVLLHVSMVVLLSIAMSWVANLGGGSVLLAVLAHNAVNWIWIVWPLLTGRTVPGGSLALFFGSALLALVAICASAGRLAVPSTQRP